MAERGSHSGVSRRVRMIVAGVVAAAALAGMVVIIVHAVGDSDSDAHSGFSLRDSQSAAPPFSSFTEARVALDDKCQRVLIASKSSQRVQGLREVRSLGPYAGMLFVF